jgi:hypothetical protein
MADEANAGGQAVEAGAEAVEAIPEVPFIFEADRRWSDFRGGREIMLPGGEVWAFYEPAAVMRDGKVGWSFEVPPDLDLIHSSRFGRILAKWQRAATDNERASTVLEASWFLLARNYAVTQAEFASILSDLDGCPDEFTTDLMAQLISLIGIALSRAAGLAEAT